MGNAREATNEEHMGAQWEREAIVNLEATNGRQSHNGLEACVEQKP
jgi:hypothetical protein